MRWLISAACALVVGTPGLVPSAHAHGGCYRHAHPDQVPPDSRVPGDPPPPTADGGALPGVATPGSAGRAPSGSKASSWSGWEHWWGHNQDEILGLRGSVRRAQLGASARTLGRRADAEFRAVTDQAIRDLIVPALRTLMLDDEQSFHVRSAAVLGLAKIGDETIVETLREFVLDADRSVHREVRETAALALGLLERDDPETRAFLIDVVRRRDLDGSYVRPFAAISLALLGPDAGPGHATTSALLDVVAGDEPGSDVRPACLLALGILGGDDVVRELLVAARTGRLARPGAEPLDQIETSYVLDALGRIGRPGLDGRGEGTAVLDAVAAVVERKHAAPGPNVRRSAAIALGRIAPQCEPWQQRRVVDLLRDLADDGGAEEQERNFALMSLGRIGAARTAGLRTRQAVVEFLRRKMESWRGPAPPFAAIALGLVGRAVIDQGGAAPERDIRAPLRTRFLDDRESASRGAYALASGLVRDAYAAGPLLDVLTDRREDKRVRGWCALALGLIGDRSAVDSLRAVLQEGGDRDLRIQCATAAGLLGDPAVIDDLLTVLQDTDSSNYEMGSAALALGRIGDERAIAPLVAIATDTTDGRPDLTRALAVVALGQIGDRRDVPSLARLATDVNYRAHVPAITELLSIL